MLFTITYVHNFFDNEDFTYSQSTEDINQLLSWLRHARNFIYNLKKEDYNRLLISFDKDAHINYTFWKQGIEGYFEILHTLKNNRAFVTRIKNLTDLINYFEDLKSDIAEVVEIEIGNWNLTK